MGFIVALINHANSEFEGSGLKWMEFFAKSTRNFTFSGLSLNDVENFDFGVYILFLDEFQGSEWTALIRNLFRAALVPVLVANTNTNAANLVGEDQSGFSRVEGSFAWSFVAVRLNAINQDMLKKMYPNFSNIVTSIIESSGSERERELIHGFFENFKNTQLQHLRPGVVELIISKLSAISNGLKLSFNSLFQFIVNFIAENLGEKKPKMNSSAEGVLGSLALYLKNAYNIPGVKSDKRALFHNKSYLQDHFYYLINPYDITNWCFLAYPPRQIEDKTRGQKIISSKSLRFVRMIENFRRILVDWNVEYTYFKDDEILTFLSCQASFNPGSIVSVLRAGLLRSRANAFNTGDSENSSQNIALKGNELEVIATICIIEASHHIVGSINSTFCGQDGESFLTNLIENLIEGEGYRRTNKVKLNCKIIKKSLDIIHVPFLFPAGMELPEFFKQNLSSPIGFNTRTVNFGEYGRTRDSTQIDGVFNYFILNESGEVPSIGVCSVECKNWKRNILAKDLISILKKATLNSADFSLIICNSLGNSKSDNLKLLIDHCKEENILLLKLKEKKLDIIKEFELVPYFSGSNDVIKMTCIIIELQVINLKETEDYEAEDYEAEDCEAENYEAEDCEAKVFKKIKSNPFPF